MATDSSVTVTVVTGFLGAGKTTLVNQWLTETARGEVAVIVNEHGDVGIDGELLAARMRTIVEITGGCVCCATQADLVRALEDLSTREPRPRRILVETSGAASPAGVLRAIGAVGPAGAFALDGVITVLDATGVDTLDEQELALEQLGYADIVVLSRADRCEPAALAHAEDVVRARNGAALLVAARRGLMTASFEELLAARAADLLPARDVPALSEHVYESVSLTLVGNVDGERFADFVETELARFAGRLFRTKGILGVAEAEERMIVQGVADAVEVTFGEPWGATPRTSRLVVVGFGLDREALVRSFAACAAG